MIDVIKQAAEKWKAYHDKPCRPPYLVPTNEELQAAYLLADVFLYENHPAFVSRMACNRCELKHKCKFAMDGYNLDTEPGIDCLATK